MGLARSKHNHKLCHTLMFIFVVAFPDSVDLIKRLKKTKTLEGHNGCVSPKCPKILVKCVTLKQALSGLNIVCNAELFGLQGKTLY